MKTSHFTVIFVVGQCLLGCGDKLDAQAFQALGAPTSRAERTLSENSNVRLCVGYSHACLVRDDHSLSCWHNSYLNPEETCSGLFERLPAPSPLAPSSVPECGQSNAPPGEFTEVACGMVHTCGLRFDGSVECWGRNNLGQLHIPTAERFVHVRSWGYDTCGVTRQGTVKCWGQHAFESKTDGWLVAGVGTTRRENTRDAAYGLMSEPSGVCGFSRKNHERVCVSWDQEHRESQGDDYLDATEGLSPPMAIGDESTYDCGIRSDGSLNCLPGNWIAPTGKYRQLTRLDHLGSPCALTTDGSAVVCFSRNAVDFPRSKLTHYAPRMISSTPLQGEFEEIAAGRFGLCGRTKTGVVHCVDQNGATFSSNRNPQWVY